MNLIVWVSALGLLVAVVLKLKGVTSSLVGLLGLTAMIALLISSFRTVFFGHGFSRDDEVNT